MILFGLLHSILGCFIPICYDFFLFGFGYGLGLLDIGLSFLFFSVPIPFSVTVFASTSPVGSEATHLRLTIDFSPF